MQGVARSKSDVQKLIKEVDKDGNGTIEFDEFLWMVKKLQESGALSSSSGSGGFGSMLGGALGKATSFGGLFGKKKFDTDAFEKQQQERERNKAELESKYLSKENRKKLEKVRRERAKTHGADGSQ